MFVITTGHFPGVFTCVSNHVEGEKLECISNLSIIRCWFHIGFFIKRNYSMRATTGFWCWYPVLTGNKDREFYIQMWFFSLFPALFYQEENLIVYPSFPSGMICTSGWILHTACQRIILVGCGSSIQIEYFKDFSHFDPHLKIPAGNCIIQKKAEWSEWIILDHTEGLRTNVSLLFAYLYLLAHLWAQKKQLSDSFDVICRL